MLQAIYHRLGETLGRLEKYGEAERFHQAALEVQPDHVATHVSYGTMLARNVSLHSHQWFQCIRLTNSVSLSLIYLFTLIFQFQSCRAAEVVKQNSGSRGR